MQWKEPYPIDEFVWMDVETYEAGQLARVGRVSWMRDGSGHYKVRITIENQNGLGLYCWPAFRVLSEAQTFVERLMGMSVEALMAEHGTQWPGVVL